MDRELKGEKMRTSEHLTVGNVYTRADLREKFAITDATIKNGIFRPRGHDSVWLFVTEDKTPDMTQYKDELNAEELHFDGQSAGLTDKLLIEHEGRGCEVILFYRRSKNEHPGAGFRYEGPFRYVDHSGIRPAHFRFQRIS
jgi:putative restriction endonuclease